MSTKTTTTIALEIGNPSLLDRILGGLCFGIFVATWISSILSPMILAWAVVYERHILASLVVLVTVIAYLPWSPRQSPNLLQQFIRRYAPCYFDKTSIVVEGTRALPLTDEPQTFYAIHPHGAFCIGWGILFCHHLFEHVRFCFAPALFISPFFRLFSRCTGNPGSAAKPAMISYMKQHRDCLALPPGGFEEATLTSLHEDRVFIRKRTGFIRLCLKYGIRVRPVYVFGEKSCYWNIQGWFQIRLSLNRFGIPTILPWGHWLIPLLPKPHCHIHIVVGAPIVLPQIDDPTPPQVQEWHDKYIAALVRLFEEHKEAAYGPERAKTTKLEVW
jgi:2-acylglycerol O-acyltransferase 2